MATVRCDHLREILSRAGEDVDRSGQEVATHLVSCAVCREEEQELSGLIARYCRSAPGPLSDDLETRLLDRLCVRLRP